MNTWKNTEVAEAEISFFHPHQHTTALYSGQATIVAATLPASRHLITLHLSLFVKLIFPTLLITIALKAKQTKADPPHIHKCIQCFF